MIQINFSFPDLQILIFAALLAYFVLAIFNLYHRHIERPILTSGLIVRNRNSANSRYGWAWSVSARGIPTKLFAAL